MMRFLFYTTRCVIFGIGVISIATTHAAGSNFQINLFVGVDTTPPTTPALQSVIPVAPTQINLTWLASTDDVFLTGYRVYRDGVPIATTTLTSFNDTGLIASTTYSYMVDAYDSFYNISSSSGAVATTTLSVPIPPATTTPTSTPATKGSGTSVPTLSSFLITPGVHDAVVMWSTIGATRYTISWGRTTSYELGTVSSNLFTIDHQTVLQDLEPGTKYFYSLSAIDGRGVSRIVKSDSFVTLASITPNIPVNVVLFTAVPRDTDVMLSWKNPDLPLGSFIRVVRSHLFYPRSLQDGALVYEGTGETVFDRGALLERSPQYYTAFVVTRDGVVSSGAITRAYRLKSGQLPVTEDPTEIPPDSGEESVLRAVDIMVVQANLTKALDETITLSGDAPFVISIPVTAVTPNLKSIIVSLTNPTNARQVSTYLLKLNQTGDAYETVIAAPNVSGQARLTVEVFDYNAATIRRISTTVAFVSTALPTVQFPDQYANWYPWFAWILSGVLLLLSWWWFILWKRRRRDEDNR